MEDLKKVFAREVDGDWYVVPIELKEEFHALVISIENNDGDEDYLNALEYQFDRTFGEYATGGDINLIELYARI